MESRGRCTISKDVAWANGDGMQHATTIVDHPPHHRVRILCTIFINEISKDNIDSLSYSVSLARRREFVCTASKMRGYGRNADGTGARAASLVC